MRNDRNKKRKKSAGAEEGLSSSTPQVVEMSPEEEKLVNELHKAQINTFPKCADEHKFKLVGRQHIFLGC